MLYSKRLGNSLSCHAVEILIAIRIILIEKKGDCSTTVGILIRKAVLCNGFANEEGRRLQ